MRMQAYWLHDLPRLRQGVWLILVGIAGSVATSIWLLTPAAVSPAPTFEAQWESASAGGDVSVRKNCQECGVVSATRGMVPSAAGVDPGIEVTVRMKDGSHRQFVDASSANWRVGERMIIINGANQAGD